MTKKIILLFWIIGTISFTYIIYRNINSKPKNDIAVENKVNEDDKNIIKEEESKKCLVEFDTDGGSVIDSQTVNCKDKIREPNKPKKDGFDFVNWTNNGVVFDFNSKIENDIVLKAEYKKVTNKEFSSVSFISDGVEIRNVEIAKGSTINEPLTPKKVGYTFVGWYSLDGDKFDFSQKINKNITLLARWDKNSTNAGDTPSGGITTTPSSEVKPEINHGNTTVSQPEITPNPETPTEPQPEVPSIPDPAVTPNPKPETPVDPQPNVPEIREIRIVPENPIYEINIAKDYINAYNAYILKVRVYLKDANIPTLVADTMYNGPVMVLNVSQVDSRNTYPEYVEYEVSIRVIKYGHSVINLRTSDGSATASIIVDIPNEYSLGSRRVSVASNSTFTSIPIYIPNDKRFVSYGCLPSLPNDVNIWPQINDNAVILNVNYSRPLNELFIASCFVQLGYNDGEYLRIDISFLPS